MIRSFFASLLLVLCFGCAAVSPWKLDSIAAGDDAFSSARLVYFDPASASHLRLEFLRLGNAVDLFISLTQYTITPTPLDPGSALVRLQFGDAPPFEEAIPLLEGRMRLRFPQETALKITRALQDGKKVSILVDGFDETVQPERFFKLYEKLTGTAAFFQNPFNGPIR